MDFTISKLDGTVLDLTGCEVKFILRSEAPSADWSNDIGAELILSIGSGITITNAGAGSGRLRLTSAQTAALEAQRHFFALRVKDAGQDIYFALMGTIPVRN